jgi:hypothetical protein
MAEPVLLAEMKKTTHLRGLFVLLRAGGSVVLVPATVTAIVMVVVTMMATSFITRGVPGLLTLVLGGNGHAGGAANRAADDGAIAATDCITYCCTCCTAYCTTKNRICCRAGLSSSSCQAEGNDRNPLVHLHGLLLSLVSGGSLVTARQIGQVVKC